MESKKTWLGMLVIVLLFGMTVVACDQEPEQLWTPDLGIWWDPDRRAYRASIFGAPNADYFHLMWSTNSSFSSSNYMKAVYSSEYYFDGYYDFAELYLPNQTITYYFKVKAGGSGNYIDSNYSAVVSRTIEYNRLYP